MNRPRPADPMPDEAEILNEALERGVADGDALLAAQWQQAAIDERAAEREGEGVRSGRGRGSR